MRVAYLSTNPSIDLAKPGGPRAHILGTIQGLEDNGVEVKLFFASNSSEIKNTHKSSKSKVAVTHSARSKLRLILSDLKRLIQCWSLDADLEKGLGIYQPDVIYERSWQFSFAGVRYAKKHQIPIFLETSGCEAEICSTAFGISSVWLANSLDVLKFRVACAVVTQSVNSVDSTIRKFRLNVPVIAKPIGFEVPLGCSDEIGQGVDAFLDFSSRFTTVVGFVGTFGIYQGPDFLMQVIAEMNCPSSNVGFLLIGGGGKQKECVEIAERQKFQNVFFTGMVKPDSVAKWLGFCNLTFVPDCDPYMSPIKVLEYGAHGLPVVVPDYLAFDGLITDGLTGKRFGGLNKESAIKTIEELAGQPALIEGMGRNIKKLVAEEFSLSKVVKPLVASMRSSLHKKS